MFNSFGFDGSVRKNVVLLLSREWPLSVKEVHSRLERQGIEVSYQAVHKTLAELLGEKIVVKQGNSFQLCEEWINSNHLFFENLGKSYESKQGVDFEKPIHLVFGSLQELARFLANDYYVKYPNPERKACACIWRHAYFMVGLTEKEINNIAKQFSYVKHCALSKCDTNLDRIFSEFFNKLGKLSYTGIKHSVKNDTFLQGDFVCQVFFAPELTKWENQQKSMS